MKWFLGATLAAFLMAVLGAPVRADDKDPQAVLDKAIKALGGEEKLKKAETISMKSKGTITFGGNDNEMKTEATAKGLDHYRAESELEINGEPRKIVRVLSGDKGWRKFGDDPMELDEDALANEKRRAYLEVIPITLVALKGKEYKLEAALEEKVGDKPATAIKITGKDGKAFTIYFDKESGLPVKQVAVVAGFGDQGDVTQEWLFKDYKDFDGIKKATKVESKRDGEDFLKSEITEFKVVEKVDPKTFSAPE